MTSPADFEIVVTIRSEFSPFGQVLFDVAWREPTDGLVHEVTVYGDVREHVARCRALRRPVRLEHSPGQRRNHVLEHARKLLRHAARKT